MLNSIWWYTIIFSSLTNLITPALWHGCVKATKLLYASLQKAKIQHLKLPKPAKKRALQLQFIANSEVSALDKLHAKILIDTIINFPWQAGLMPGVQMWQKIVRHSQCSAETKTRLSTRIKQNTVYFEQDEQFLWFTIMQTISILQIGYQKINAHNEDALEAFFQSKKNFAGMKKSQILDQPSEEVIIIYGQEVQLPKKMNRDLQTFLENRQIFDEEVGCSFCYDHKLVICLGLKS